MTVYILEPNVVPCKAPLNPVSMSLDLNDVEHETLSISPTISSSALSLCYATYSTTTTSHLTKFAQSTPTTEISSLNQGIYVEYHSMYHKC